MRLRRVVLAALAVVLTLLAAGVAIPASAADQTFTDVPPDAPFHADIEWLAAEGISRGNADGSFRPGAPVTRQAMAVFLHHFAYRGVPVPRCSSSPYPDVPATSLYCGSITWLSDAEITRGTAAGTFRPLGSITRQAMAAFLYHLEFGGSAPPTCTYDAYDDVPASSAFCGSVAWLYAQGITTSSPSGNFGPTTPVTRGMMAAFLHRYERARNVVLGADVSYPQCNQSLPTGQAFGIVGVNGGLPTTANPCLATQLAWATGSTGRTSQPKVQVYVNTANPGAVMPRVSTWPTAGTNSHGTCDGTNSAACAYEYGRARATYDLGLVAGPQSYVWWLDVETMNSWETGTVAGRTRNRAVLEGMLDRFLAAGIAQVGLYSTAYQWGQIVGTVPPGSPLLGRPSWLATGPTGVATAHRECAEAPLTAGGRVVMTQFIAGAFDRNYVC